jgi:hypothetical protein
MGLVAVMEVAAADSLQGACLSGKQTEITGTRQRRGVIVASLASVTGKG